jgi:hypothetical protein
MDLVALPTLQDSLFDLMKIELPAHENKRLGRYIIAFCYIL